MTANIKAVLDNHPDPVSMIPLIEEISKMSLEEFAQKYPSEYMDKVLVQYDQWQKYCADHGLPAPPVL